MVRNDRPPIITLLCGLSFLNCLASLLGMAMLLAPGVVWLDVFGLEVSRGSALGYSLLQLVGLFVASWYALEGRNWARWLFVALLIGSTVWAFYAYHDPFVAWIAAVVNGAAVPAFFIPDSNRFFALLSRPGMSDDA